MSVALMFLAKYSIIVMSMGSRVFFMPLRQALAVECQILHLLRVWFLLFEKHDTVATDKLHHNIMSLKHQCKGMKIINIYSFSHDLMIFMPKSGKAVFGRP